MSTQRPFCTYCGRFIPTAAVAPGWFQACGRCRDADPERYQRDHLVGRIGDLREELLVAEIERHLIKS